MPFIEPKDQSLKSLTGLHLWHAPMSSCSQRVRIVLAETGQGFESHLVALEKDEHASPEYQAIHPKGLVPALVDDGRLMIESVDIIAHLGGDAFAAEGADDLLARADVAQMDLKLLTFEFLFRAHPPPPPEAVSAFQASHRNHVLKQFKLDFAKGFDAWRVNEGVARTDAGFQHLDELLADGRAYLCGAAFSIADIAWMPNVHRMRLMDWPFERTPHLAGWFDRVAARKSYKTGLTDWQPGPVAQKFADYTAKRRAAGTDVRSMPHFQS